MSVTYEQIKQNLEINTYIRKADESLLAMGYTEHSFPHVIKTAKEAFDILKELDFDPRTCELASIAGYMHDIGNVVNREDHAQSGAIMSFRILGKLGMPPDEIATVIAAIGNHDESTAVPVSPVSAALILADKSDVRRSRVRSSHNPSTYDIHDRVNHAVDQSELVLDTQGQTITLYLHIDSDQCAVVDYFEIFLGRMLLCRRAADYLDLHFQLVVNGAKLL